MSGHFTSDFPESGSAGASLRRLVIRESLLRQFEFVLGFVRGWLCRGGRSGGVVAMVGGVRRRARVVVGRVGGRGGTTSPTPMNSHPPLDAPHIRSRLADTPWPSNVTVMWATKGRNT